MTLMTPIPVNAIQSVMEECVYTANPGRGHRRHKASRLAQSQTVKAAPHHGFLPAKPAADQITREQGVTLRSCTVVVAPGLIIAMQVAGALNTALVTHAALVEPLSEAVLITQVFIGQKSDARRRRRPMGSPLNRSLDRPRQHRDERFLL